MQHARLDHSERPGCFDRLGQPFESVTHDDAGVFDATVLDFGEDLQPVLGAFAAVADPQPEGAAFAVNSDPDRRIHGPAGDLAVLAGS